MSGIEQGKAAPENEVPITPNPYAAFFDMFGDWLWSEIQQRFKDTGRGAVVIDTATAVRLEDEKDQEGHDVFLTYGYIDQRNVEEMGKPDLIRKVHTYDPTREYIAIFVRGEDVTTYRVGVFPDENKPTQTQETG